MQIQAKAVKKGQKVSLYGVIVQVTKREKWNSSIVRIHFCDCGNGLPLGYRTSWLEHSAYLPLEKLLTLL